MVIPGLEGRDALPEYAESRITRRFTGKQSPKPTMAQDDELPKGKEDMTKPQREALDREEDDLFGLVRPW